MFISVLTILVHTQTQITTTTHYSLQMLTNVQVLKQTNVTPTPCVPTLKDLMFVAVRGDMLEMVTTAQVIYLRSASSITIDVSFSIL